MRKFLRKIVLTVTILNVCIGGSVSATMTPTFPNATKYSRGVSNCCYYVDSTASGYTSSINAAADNWVDTGYGWNPIYMTPVASNYGTHMDFYGRTTANDGYLDSTLLGYVTHWNADSTLNGTINGYPTSDYYYAEVIFNLGLANSYDYRTAKHEMGHAFGLAHNESSYSIMCPNIADTYVTTVQQCDHDTINYLYN